MLKSISWTNFFLAIAIIAFAYYVVIILLCYRDELKAFTTKSRNKEMNSEGKASDPESTYHDKNELENS